MASIFELLLQDTTPDADVHAWSLPNVRREASGQERWIGTRKLSRLDRFAADRDVDGHGVFFCASTIQKDMPRKKEFAVQMPFLFADVDFKDHDASPEEIERVLRNLDNPPSRLHHTGNGIHAFWRLSVPLGTDQMDEGEALLKLLAAYLGGDPMVAHKVALLRVPGTHNTKRGERLPVRVIHEGTASYSLERMRAWMGSVRGPVLVRRGREGREEGNPFLRTAEEQAFRPPVDVAARLDDMRVGGEGEAGVHATQLSCTASMMAAGVDLEDAVSLVLDATRAVAGTEGWDWVREERVVRAMCEDAVEKFGAAKKSKMLAGAASDNPQPGVVSLAEVRSRKEEEKEAAKERALDKVSKKLKNEHVVIGRGILHELEESGVRIMYADDQCWRYRQGTWSSLDINQEKQWLNVLVEQRCVLNKLVPNTKIVNETRAWLQRQPHLNVEHPPWDEHGGIATASGLVDWRTGQVTPLRPEHYATRVVDCDYDPAAACPTWLRMLGPDYGFDDGTIMFLQDLLGTSLWTDRPRTLRRALVLLGPSNTGKSNILNVMAGLVGKEQNSTELKGLENAHGLMQFLKPNPWVLHEAFDQSRWEMSATAKALLSGDAVHVNVKNGPLLSLEFKQPVFWGTNVPPQFREASRAMENRLAIVRMRRAFDPMRPTGTAVEASDRGHNNPGQLVLATERAGVLNWAIEGLRRSAERGHFVFTEEMTQSLQAMRVDSNMATGFMSECCEHDASAYILTSDFYGAFATWHRDHRGGQQPSVDSLGRAMSSLGDPRVLCGQRISHKRVYAGIKLNGEGLDCWNAHSASVQAERSGMRISERDADVNKTIGPEPLQKAEFRAMQQAHADWSGDGD